MSICPFLPVHLSSHSFLILPIPYQSAAANTGHWFLLCKLVYKNTEWRDSVSIIPWPSLIPPLNGMPQLLWVLTKYYPLSYLTLCCYSDILTQNLYYLLIRLWTFPWVGWAVEFFSPVLWRLRSHLRPLFRCLFLACFFFTCIGLREPPSLVDTGLWEDNLDRGYNYYIDPGFVWPKDFMVWSHSVM